jgi:lysophospholipase L1-like esterase
MRRVLCAVVALIYAGLATQASAAEGVLVDTNGDGQIEVLAFGDSITYGVGDGSKPGDFVPDIVSSGSPRGYPMRLSTLLGLPVYNAGVPGEQLSGSGSIGSGIERFPKLVVGSSVDVVIIMEGANDAQYLVSTRTLSSNLQRAINVARAEGKKIVLATITPPTGSRAQFGGFTAAYSNAIRSVAANNLLPLADVEATFHQACPQLETCSLYNLPEGLHPNTVGYDAISETMAVALGGN